MNDLPDNNINPDEKTQNIIQDEGTKEKALELEKYYPSTSLAKSFGHALYGIKETWQYERNFQIHCVCALLAVVLGLSVKLDQYNWLALILVISFVLITELINTSLEHLVDLAANSLYHPLAKAAKDAAAGAVLIASFCAVMCGCIIFIPPLLSIYQHISAHY